MSYNVQQPYQTITDSPRSLAKKIESCIVRNAFDEECRAQKALHLLQTRDRRIAFLEKRVAELEETAADMHAMSLRASSTLSCLDGPSNRDAFYSVSQSERSIKLENDRGRTCHHRVNTEYESRSSLTNQTKVPNLRLSSSTLYTDKEIFSTPALDWTYQKIPDDYNRVTKDYFYIDSSDVSERRTRSMKEIRDEERSEICETIRTNGVDDYANEKSLDENAAFTLPSTNVEKRAPKKEQPKFLNEKDEERTEHVLSRGRNYETKFPFGVSSSVARIRTKRKFRKKIRPFAARVRKQKKGDQRSERIDVSSFRTIEAVSRANEDDDVDAAGPVRISKVSKNPRTLEKKNETGCDVEKGKIIVGRKKNNVETKAAFTQTCKSCGDREQKNLYAEENDYTSRSTPTIFYDDRRKWDIVEDPAPQWLIEEALGRGNEVCKEKEWQKSVESIHKETEYENIISELEKKLNETKNELEEAVKGKTIVKEKYKRILQNVKMDACKENEALQGKIVQIYTSLLDKFGPYILLKNKKNGCQNKNHKPSRYFGKLSKRLYKKLRFVIKISKKLKLELSNAREVIKDKSEKYESVNKRFELLKQEMESTELNLNELIDENASLRKKFEDMKEWMELKIGKEQNERISITQIRELPKYRELANLKKKSEEDCATIKQLHNKLLRSESANANKGFLLNSYKGQLSDLAKEKDQFASKIKELENEVTMLRTSNAQLKAKITLINQEKENLASTVEKSETDLKQQIESQLNGKYEESMRDEINAVRTKCEDAIKVLKEKLTTFESKNAEYSKAIKEFLKKIHDHCNERVEQDFFECEASEREAHETACNILNMTPEELANFMNERSGTINAWLLDVNKITSTTSFSDGLAKFLFKTTLEKICVSI